MAVGAAGRKSAGLTHWRCAGGTRGGGCSGRTSRRSSRRGCSRRGARGGSGAGAVSATGSWASADGASSCELKPSGTSECGSRKPPAASASCSVCSADSVGGAADSTASDAGEISSVPGAPGLGVAERGMRPRPPRRPRRRLLSAERRGAGEFKLDCSSGTKLSGEDGGLARKSNGELRGLLHKQRQRGRKTVEKILVADGTDLAVAKKSGDARRAEMRLHQFRIVAGPAK